MAGDQAAGAESGDKEYLGMSDADFLGMDLNEFSDGDADGAAEDEPPAAESDASDSADPEDDQDGDEGADDDDAEDENDDGEHGTTDSGNADDGSGDADDGDDAATGDDDGTDGEEASGDDADDRTDNDSPVDPQTFYERVTSEFKANGKPMKIDNPDDVIRLMQMGANYNRKMAALKPNLKIMKMLEKNELIDEDKLGFLIDLNQKNPAAIAKLLADSKIDPLDLNLEEGNEYKASDYSVDDREIALDEVVEELRESPTYPKTINLVTTQWDDSSKQRVANEPQLLKVLDSHMANGVYDRISTEVEQERTLGRLNGMSDIEAYTAIGDAIAARGGFDDLKGSSQPSKTQQTQRKPDSTSQAKQVAEQKRRDKRRAASPSKPAAPASDGNKDFNPLSMSDDEYLKQFDAKFL